MKRLTSTFVVLSIIFFSLSVAAQRRGASRNSKSSSTLAKKVLTNKAIVVDERLAVLRVSPSLYAQQIQRMSGGREVSVRESKEADGVTFYRVITSPKSSGWVQADAIAGTFRRGDDERIARLVQASEGFDRIERLRFFSKCFPNLLFVRRSCCFSAI